ncbi:MFS transporter [Paraburkholderia antibiotica]|uniref:MFS transporter n=1 Tax=Paraburkholderia antibiotica TaxID=2728839 RepID=A0A7X9X7H7_9BURK|nr:MFS transporter [Paraburkholderia antibiotica]
MALQGEPFSSPVSPVRTGLRAGESGFEEATYRKVAWRLVPLLLLCYVVAYLDRVNVGFAKLPMASDLQLSDAVYGFGAGVFFLGYFLFEIPSNLILHRVGARIWIARIMVTWGLISCLTMFVSSPTWFYIMRFALGVAEAGFFPGIIVYLTCWFPAHRRARMTSRFIVAVPLSGMIGGPLSGYILKTFDGVHGWHGWQWLFLLEGLPSIAVGVLVLLCLDDRIGKAKWLSDDEKALLERNVEIDNAGKESLTFGAVMTDARIWLICAMHFCFVMGMYGVGFWLPTLIKGAGVVDPWIIGVLSMIPAFTAVVMMLGVARSADLRRERRWHTAAPALCGAVALLLAVAWSHDTTLAMIALSLATAGILTTLPLFWCFPTAILAGAGAAAGIALVNAMGNVAGFVGPYAVGWLRELTGTPTASMVMLAGFMFVGGCLALCFPRELVNR